MKTPQEHKEAIGKIVNSSATTPMKLAQIKEYVKNAKDEQKKEEKQIADAEKFEQQKELALIKSQQPEIHNKTEVIESNNQVKIAKLLEQLVKEVKKKSTNPLEIEIDRNELKGEDGRTPTEQELRRLIKPLIPTEKVERQTVVREVIKEITHKKFHIKNLDGVSELQDFIVRHAVEQARGLLYAGLFDIKLKAGANVTITQSADGTYTISSTGGGPVVTGDLLLETGDYILLEDSTRLMFE